MKLYNSIGPNPHAVRMFLAEKGIEIPKVPVDLMKGENREATHLARNPAGQLPALELDDGTFISEITAICEYVEELHPNPPLIGTTPKERAETRMWARRVDLNIIEPLAGGFRNAEGLPIFTGRIPVEPEIAAGLKRIAQNRQLWFDKMMQGRQWICGNRFTYADILLYCFLNFGQVVGQQINPEAMWIKAWIERVKARPSASV
ncbi:MAG: glutathione S-transferase family protein [Alphaproteobacteria bacterium]|nr:glutathione S-transferase family protein [Alphaproteobacteria bacterium]